MSAARLSAWLDTPDSALNLAVLRIVVFATLLYWATLGQDIAWFANLPHELMVPPIGTGWLVTMWPITPLAARIMQAVVVVACLCAIVGLRTRVAAAVVVLAGVYLFGLPELWGKINHYHHLWWLAVVLALSPCGDALALEARGRGVPARSAAYGRPLRYAWILLGLVYLFPGIWKLMLGAEWWASDNMKWQMYQKWVETGYVIPPLRLDRYPTLYRLGGLATVLFELSFLPLVLWRRTRPVALLAGLGFHVLCAYTLLIWFWILPVCYVMFVDWESWARRLGWRPQAERPPSAPARWLPLIATEVIVLVALCGALRIDSWPFAVYPTFASLAPPTRTTLELQLDGPGGQATPLAPATLASIRDRFENSRWATVMDRLITARDSTHRAQLANGVATLLRATDGAVQSAEGLAIYQVTVPVDPARWSEPPLERRLVAIVPLAPPPATVTTAAAAR